MRIAIQKQLPPCGIPSRAWLRCRRDSRIGQALKLAGIQYCLHHGATKMGDNHDARDATNLALNYSMGFMVLPSVIYLEKKLA
jgi:hypothetical protein